MLNANIMSRTMSKMKSTQLGSHAASSQSVVAWATQKGRIYYAQQLIMWMIWVQMCAQKPVMTTVLCELRRRSETAFAEPPFSGEVSTCQNEAERKNDNIKNLICKYYFRVKNIEIKARTRKPANSSSASTEVLRNTYTAGRQWSKQTKHDSKHSFLGTCAIIKSTVTHTVKSLDKWEPRKLRQSGWSTLKHFAGDALNEAPAQCQHTTALSVKTTVENFSRIRKLWRAGLSTTIEAAL